MHFIYFPVEVKRRRAWVSTSSSNFQVRRIYLAGIDCKGTFRISVDIESGQTIPLGDNNMYPLVFKPGEHRPGHDAVPYEKFIYLRQFLKGPDRMIIQSTAHRHMQVKPVGKLNGIDYFIKGPLLFDSRFCVTERV